mgnify:CR=1 FL=1
MIVLPVFLADKVGMSVFTRHGQYDCFTRRGRYEWF